MLEDYFVFADAIHIRYGGVQKVFYADSAEYLAASRALDADPIDVEAIGSLVFPKWAMADFPEGVEFKHGSYFYKGLILPEAFVRASWSFTKAQILALANAWWNLHSRVELEPALAAFTAMLQGRDGLAPITTDGFHFAGPSNFKIEGIPLRVYDDLKRHGWPGELTLDEWWDSQVVCPMSRRDRRVMLSGDKFSSMPMLVAMLNQKFPGYLPCPSTPKMEQASLKAKDFEAIARVFEIFPKDWVLQTVRAVGFEGIGDLFSPNKWADVVEWRKGELVDDQGATRYSWDWAWDTFGDWHELKKTPKIKFDGPPAVFFAHLVDTAVPAHRNAEEDPEMHRYIFQQTFLVRTPRHNHELIRWSVHLRNCAKDEEYTKAISERRSMVFGVFAAKATKPLGMVEWDLNQKVMRQFTVLKDKAQVQASDKWKESMKQRLTAFADQLGKVPVGLPPANAQGTSGTWTLGHDVSEFKWDVVAKYTEDSNHLAQMMYNYKYCWELYTHKDDMWPSPILAQLSEPI